MPLPQLEFSMFNRENPRSWVRRCEKYYEVYGVNEHKKLELTTIHMDPRVDISFHGYLAEKGGVVNWEMFAQDMQKI